MTKKKSNSSKNRSRTITALLLIVLSILGIALFFERTTIGDEPTTNPTSPTGEQSTTGNLAGNAIAQSGNEGATPNYNSFVRRQKEKIKEINNIIQGNESGK